MLTKGGVVIAAHPGFDGEVDAAPLGQEAAGFVVRRDDARCAFVDTLAWEHVGLDPASAANQMQARAAALAGKRVRYRAVVSNFESALRVVRANLGISIIPREIAATYTETFPLRVIPLSDAWAKRRFVIARRAKEPLPKGAALLVRYLEQAARGAA